MDKPNSQSSLGDKTPLDHSGQFFRDEYSEENELEIHREEYENRRSSLTGLPGLESPNPNNPTPNKMVDSTISVEQHKPPNFHKKIESISVLNGDETPVNENADSQNPSSKKNVLKRDESLTQSLEHIPENVNKLHIDLNASHTSSHHQSFGDLVRRVSMTHLYNHPNIIELEIEKMEKHPTVAKLDHVFRYSKNQVFAPIPSPMMSTSVYTSVYGGKGFIPQDAFIYPLSVINFNVSVGPEKHVNDLCFIKGGPRSHIYFNPKQVVAAIVTCGGLCPGLNAVIREITYTLWQNYGVSKIYGIQYGYRGFYTYNWLELSPQSTKHIHKLGGTILGSSRGGFDLKRIMARIKSKGVNQIYVIGGDGTLKGAAEILKYVRENKLEIAVASLPKTIDNDIMIIDRSFGYQTAVEEALKAINSAETEAMSAEYGIGLVKLMGRAAGHIALEACLSQRGVNVLLIPEIKFEINGPNGLLEYIYRRLLVKHHCVIVVAEGASEAVLDGEFPDLGVDASGNKIFPDIGTYIRKKIVTYCSSKGLEATLKYIDPTYMIRTTASNAYDTQICAQLAYNSVHGTMSGFSGFCTALVNNKSCYIPVDLLTQGNKKIQPKSRKWQRLLAATGQPSFRNNEELAARDQYQARENLPKPESE